MERYVLGMDVGGTNIRVGTCASGMELENFIRVPRSSVLTGSNSMLSLAEFTEDYINKYRGGQRPEAMAIGFPAILSRDRRTILQTPNIPGLDNVSAAAELEEQLHIPVYLERDVNLLFYCDIAANNISGDGVGIGVYVGTGIGNAIFLDGTPLPSKDGVSGELGHISLPGNHSKCGCGNVGCAECLASGWHLVDLQKEHFADTAIPELFLNHAAEAPLKEFVDNIACVIATEINILNPDYIVLGGGVISMAGFPLEELKARIFVHARKPYPAESLNYFASCDSSDNGVKGALVYAWSKL